MKKKIKEPGRIELSQKEINDLQSKIQQNNLSGQEQELLVKVLQSFVWLNKMLEAKKLSMRKLARLFGFKTEKQPKKDDDDKKPPKSSTGGSGDKKKGHGRNGQDKYPGAKREYHQHQTLKAGDRCPSCNLGNLYGIDPGTFIHIKGAPPLQATVHEEQKLRCATCGEIFTATAPQEVRKQKYDETADVMIALSRYGKGVPFYRLDKWQKYLGVPLPASTQWERVEELASSTRPVFNHCIKLASSGEVSFIDDTGNKILDLKKRLKEEKSDRTGIYTTGIVSRVKNRTINLFFTGNRHAGENLDRLLETRPDDLPSMLQMSDALASNHLKKALTIECLCMTHGRRNFVDATPDRPRECAYVIHLLGKLYHNDKVAQEKNLSDDARLKYHQRKSGPVIKKLRRFLLKSFYLKKIEPNESVGEAIQYMLNHWKGLTQFLRVPGAPLDNTICERALKKIILHRKNSLFFKTTLGAYVGDIITSLIQTCVSAGKNPFEYLLAIHMNRKEVFRTPEKFLPWTFEENLSGYHSI